MSVAVIATVDDLVVGLLVGAAVGVIAGPVLRSWIACREWTNTRREATLTDELLTRLEALDLEGPDDAEAAAGEGPSVRSPHPLRWRTSR